MATSYVDPYHQSLIPAMRQIFGEQSTLGNDEAEAEDEKPKTARTKVVKAPAAAAPEKTQEGVETK
jgi:hypothetical protein